MFYPIDDCGHLLLYLLGIGIASEEKAMSGFCQQNLAGICNSVCFWLLIMINKTKRPPIDWERIFTNPKSDRGLMSNIYKELLSLGHTIGSEFDP